MQRFVAAIITSIIYSLALAIWGYETFSDTLFFTLIFATPVFVVAELLTPPIVEIFKRALGFTERHTYVSSLTLYMLMGVLFGALFLLYISKGLTEEHGFDYLLFSVGCIFGSLLFYHVYLLLSKSFKNFEAKRID